MPINRPKTHQAAALRKHLNQPGILTMPGAFNAA
jgi:hypothetical protein